MERHIHGLRAQQLLLPKLPLPGVPLTNRPKIAVRMSTIALIGRFLARVNSLGSCGMRATFDLVFLGLFL